MWWWWWGSCCERRRRRLGALARTDRGEKGRQDRAVHSGDRSNLRSRGLVGGEGRTDRDAGRDGRVAITRLPWRARRDVWRLAELEVCGRETVHLVVLAVRRLRRERGGREEGRDGGDGERMRDCRISIAEEGW